MIKIVDLFGMEHGKLISTPAEEVMELTAPKHEEGACLLIRNGGSDEIEVTVKAGNSIYATDDLTLTVGADEHAVISLRDTGRFKNVQGEKSGKIIVEMSGDITLAEICALYL